MLKSVAFLSHQGHMGFELAGKNYRGAMAAEARTPEASDLIVYVYPTRIASTVMWMSDEEREHKKAEAPVTEVTLLQDGADTLGYKVLGYEMATDARLDLDDWLLDVGEMNVIRHPEGKPFYWYLVEYLDRDREIPEHVREAIQEAPELDWSDFKAPDGAEGVPEKPKVVPAYNPGASESYAGAVADFVAGPVVDDVQTVPGITKAGARILRKAGVETTFQLLGKGLDCRTEGGDTRTTCDAFYRWLKEAGINSHRNTVVRGVMEKLNTMMDGMYNEEEL